jgi:threonine aldolase
MRIILFECTMMSIDLRSDTVTKPTAGMLDAMMRAPVGDDVFGEDPSVNLLESTASQLFGMEAALFCPTGTMSNQVAIKSHTQPGDEVICEKQAHIYIYEGGGIAFNSGAQARCIEGDRGRIKAQDVQASINPDDVHRPRTSLVCLENSSNRGGGSCYEFAEILRIRKLCDEHGLILHLDGARLFNALVAKKETPAQYGRTFDSISFCLNKGLGCPVGSVLLGRSAFIRQARRIRKVLGGGMRQAGYMAAAGLYALEHHVARLEQDHRFAKRIAESLEQKPFVQRIMPVETNIVILETKPDVPAKRIAENFHRLGVQVIAIGEHQVRLVTHLDISESMMDQVVEVIRKL